AGVSRRERLRWFAACPSRRFRARRSCSRHSRLVAIAAHAHLKAARTILTGFRRVKKTQTSNTTLISQEKMHGGAVVFGFHLCTAKVLCSTSSAVRDGLCALNMES